MIAIDRDALLCDLAETYGVFSFDSVPVLTLATLCAGLRGNSRIRHSIGGYKEVPPEFTLVHIADALTILLSAFSDKTDVPKLYSDIMSGKREEIKNSGFDSIEAFEAARERIINAGSR